MALQFKVIGLVVSDLEASLAFYRRLGVAVPADHDSGHVHAPLPGGLVLAWDTVETIHSFDPEWTPPRGDHRVALAFQCDSPDEVDRGVRRPRRGIANGCATRGQKLINLGLWSAQPGRAAGSAGMALSQSRPPVRITLR